MALITFADKSARATWRIMLVVVGAVIVLGSILFNRFSTQLGLGQLFAGIVHADAVQSCNQTSCTGTTTNCGGGNGGQCGCGVGCGCGSDGGKCSAGTGCSIGVGGMDACSCGNTNCGGGGSGSGGK